MSASVEREVDILAGVDRGLTMQKQVISVFGDQDMREQPGPGTATMDR